MFPNPKEKCLFTKARAVTHTCHSGKEDKYLPALSHMVYPKLDRRAQPGRLAAL